MANQAQWRLDDAAAEYYEAHFVPALFAQCAERVIGAADPRRGERVLDVACGTGVAARASADRVGGEGQVTGIDASPSMIAIARRLRPEIEWRVGEAEKLPFGDGSFDIVVCQAALMFFPDRVSALREMGRVLRPEGRMVVQVFGDSAGYAVLGEALEEVAGREKAEIFRGPFSLRNRDDVIALFNAAGIEGVRVETDEVSARFGSVEAMVRTEIDGWVLRGQVDIEALLAAVEERLQPFCDGDGAVRVPVEIHLGLVEGR